MDRLPFVKHAEFSDEEGVQNEFIYLNKTPLNDTNFDLKIDFVEYWKKRPDGRKQRFSWVTDLPVEDHNMVEIMRTDVNETFNNLKNQDYNFEHNLGHGYKRLSNVLAYLMMLAFLPDLTEILQSVLKSMKESRASQLILGEVEGYVLQLFTTRMGSALLCDSVQESASGTLRYFLT